MKGIQDIAARSLAMPLPSSLSQTARALSEVVFPQTCLGCGASARDALPVCAPCLGRLPRATHEEVRAELAQRGAPDDLLVRAAALWRFDSGGTVQRIQHALKYRGRPGLGLPLGRLLARAFTADVPSWTPDVVAPIPLSDLRRLERGYNQSEGLAEGAAAEWAAAFAPDLLVRTRPTRSQTRLSPTQRWTNVRGAFAPTKGYNPEGLRVLLVDDVLTTGATLLAAAEPLRDAGAEVGLASLAFAT